MVSIYLKKKQKKICFSNRSNEPYFCTKNEKVKPTAPSYEHIEWIVTGKNRPFMGAWDIVPSQADRVPITFQLSFLDNKDPLITSWNNLGPNIKVWGLFPTFFRNSPPGMAIYNTPSLKPIWKTAQYFYFNPDNLEAFKLHKKASSDFFFLKPEEVLKINSKRFLEALKLKSYLH